MGNTNSMASEEPRPTTSTSPRCGNYRVIDYLNKGSFGEVVVAYHKTNPRSRYVLKLIPEEYFSNCAEELNVLQELQGLDGVVQYVEHFQIDDTIVIVTEYTPGEDLFNYINRNGPLSELSARFVFRQLCEIMHKVHNKGIVHRDLKPENILIDDNLCVTILDWGFAFYPEKTNERKSCGSPNYAAPEVITTPPRYKGPEVDVWSLGVILYAMLTACLPFNEDYIPRLFKSIRSCQVNYQRKGLVVDAVELLKQIFVRYERITICNVLTSAFCTY